MSRETSANANPNGRFWESLEAAMGKADISEKVVPRPDVRDANLEHLPSINA
jgi:hypothetical protein